MQIANLSSGARFSRNQKLVSFTRSKLYFSTITKLTVLFLSRYSLHLVSSPEEQLAFLSPLTNLWRPPVLTCTLLRMFGLTVVPFHPLTTPGAKFIFLSARKALWLLCHFNEIICNILVRSYITWHSCRTRILFVRDVVDFDTVLFSLLAAF